MAIFLTLLKEKLPSYDPLGVITQTINVPLFDIIIKLHFLVFQTLNNKIALAMVHEKVTSGLVLCLHTLAHASFCPSFSRQLAVTTEKYTGRHWH